MIDWQVEVAALQDMSIMVCESHRVAAQALWNGIAAASELEDGVVPQKVLTAKLAAESVSAAEDLGALALSIGNRAAEGILRRYLNYKPTEVRRFYARVGEGVSLRELIGLPEDSELSPFLNASALGTLARSVASLQDVLRMSAGNYLALNGALIRTYNKVKHGFVVVVRLDALIAGRQPPTDWKQNVNVLTGVRNDGSILYTDLERSVGMLESLMRVIEMCALAFKELASLVIWLSEQSVPLGLTRAKRGT